MRLFLDNVRGIVVLIGAGWCYYGIAQWSLPVAHIAGGVLLMAVGSYPYLCRQKGH